MAQIYHKLKAYRDPTYDRDKIIIEEDDLGTPASSNAATKLQMIVQFIVGTLISLLAIRFMLVLFGANQGNTFVDFIYGLTSPLVAPFQGLFNVSYTAGVARFEFETIFAGFIYAIVGAGIIKLIDLFKKISKRSNN